MAAGRTRRGKRGPSAAGAIPSPGLFAAWPPVAALCTVLGAVSSFVLRQVSFGHPVKRAAPFLFFLLFDMNTDASKRQGP